MKKMPQFILYASFLLLIAFSFVILFGAFWDHKTTNQEIKSFIINNELMQVDSVGNYKVIPELNSIIDKIEFKVDKLLEGNTVSFLFQVFAILLVTIGVYLLDKSNEKQKKLEQESAFFLRQFREWKELVNSNQLVIGVSNILADAVYNSRELKNAPKETSAFAPSIRESLQKTLQNIQLSTTRKVFIEKNYKDFILSQLVEIKNNLHDIELTDSDYLTSNISKLESFFGDNNNFVSVINLEESSANTKG